MMLSYIDSASEVKVRKNWSEDDKKLLIWIIGKLAA